MSTRIHKPRMQEYHILQDFITVNFGDDIILLLSFYHLHDIPNVRIKFDNNWSSNFGNYLTNKNRHKQTTEDGQTETRDLPFSYSWGYETSANKYAFIG
ncbi:hypothetical protein Zmor_023923 [Zophobas morio]|uniref:Uncharacterized protein n=1 Tax=Zophobas morio TaxID=2755281 RepID=A0AA38I0V3_9CUCU|nr:hypothetical protein Zmor_023923 [Zophobas morio]